MNHVKSHKINKKDDKGYALVYQIDQEVTKSESIMKEICYNIMTIHINRPHEKVTNPNKMIIRGMLKYNIWIIKPNNSNSMLTIKTSTHNLIENYLMYVVMGMMNGEHDLLKNTWATHVYRWEYQYCSISPLRL